MNQNIDFARHQDAIDPLRSYRSEFIFPKSPIGNEYIYFCGNSLGLQPRGVQEAVQQELDDWANHGVLAHHASAFPWYRYHEFLTQPMATIVGAQNNEVVVMNTLTTNVHLMMVSFYRPTAHRHKIVIEHSTFPSDRYAVESQIRFHGYDPAQSLIVLKPEHGSDYISPEHIQKLLEAEGEQIALVLIGCVNYYTGQAYPIKKISDWAREKGCCVGFDLAHGVGNLLLNLHDDGPDFAVWCGYKYLNGGPGTLGGIFVHNRHENSPDIPRFAGWWGHNKSSRFQMKPHFDMMPGAEGWQLSNPPILPMACLRVSLSLFEQAGMQNLRKKSLALTEYLIELIQSLRHPNVEIISPLKEDERGCQVSIRIKDANKNIYTSLEKYNIIADWREPDVVRVAPVPLYNSFEDVYHLYKAFKEILGVE